MRDGRVETVRETWNVLTKDDLSQMLMDGATSTEFVFARPNRLVLMVGGVWHRVNVVKRNVPFRTVERWRVLPTLTGKLCRACRTA